MTPRLAPDTKDLIWFEGEDAVRFLNDLLSQEIEVLDPGSVARSFLLGPQGKLDHLLWVLRTEKGAGLVTDHGRGDDLAVTLGRYRIRVDVDIRPASTPASLVVGAFSPEPGSFEVTAEGLEAALPWAGPHLSLRTGTVPSLDRIPADEWEAIRILAGEPRFGVDVDSSTIPQETGLVAEAVDFAKGCYLGQELVARIDSRGHVNRYLRRLEFEKGGPPVGSEILFEGSGVGILTSASGTVGLGLIRREVSVGETVAAGGLLAKVRETRPVS